MRIVLIYCGIGVAGFNANRPLGDREGSWIGHGIASIGASLKADGHEVSLIDLRQLSGWEHLGSIIEASPADVYGLSVSAVDHYSALKTVYEIKSRFRDSWVVVGGIHPSIFPRQYDYSVIDTVIMGEGEITFPKLIRMIERKEDIIPKVMRGEKPDLDGLQWVDRELFDYHREIACNFAPDQKTPSITMLAGRGCAYKCAYCQPAENAVFGHPYRMRSPEDVVEEMVALKARYGFKSVTFWDDTFTFSLKWIDRFCSIYETERFGATIAACSRADIICRNEGMVERLASVGLDWFVIGLESGSQRVLDFMSKGTTVKQNIEATRICRKYGVKIFGTYMYGLPTESKEEVLETARMIDEIRPEHASPFWYVPIPGTSLYEYCDDHNLLLDGDSSTIARTGVFKPWLKGIDYDFITSVMQGYRGKDAA